MVMVPKQGLVPGSPCPSTRHTVTRACQRGHRGIAPAAPSVCNADRQWEERSFILVSSLYFFEPIFFSRS